MNIHNKKSISKIPYQGILDRDNHECQFFCGKYISEYFNPLIIFFLDGNRKNLKPENLLTLCVKCILQLPPRKKMNLGAEIKSLNDQGIIHGIRNVDDLDEAPSAYKDISKVMENQKDLVKIEVELQPLAVIKA